LGLIEKELGGRKPEFCRGSVSVYGIRGLPGKADEGDLQIYANLMKRAPPSGERGESTREKSFHRKTNHWGHAVTPGA